MKIGALFLLTLLTLTGHSQNNINSYKYVLLPQKFDFLHEYDQYGLNTTTKSLLESKGFVVFWSNGNLPQDLAANGAPPLIAEVTSRKAMFTTNLTFELKDCTGNILFKSKEGRSWEKEYSAAYYEAIHAAFASFNDVPYKYDSTASAAIPHPLGAAIGPRTGAPAGRNIDPRRNNAIDPRCNNAVDPRCNTSAIRPRRSTSRATAADPTNNRPIFPEHYTPRPSPPASN